MRRVALLSTGKDGSTARRTGAAALAALLGALAAFLLPEASPAFNAKEYDSPFGAYGHTLYDEMGRVGAVWIRHPLSARRLQPTEGGPYVWTSWESDLAQTEPRGLNYAPVLSLGECWLTGRPDSANDFPSHAPLDLVSDPDPVTAYSAVYYDLIYNLVSEFSGRVDHLTVENEANGLGFWAGNADEYVRTLKTAYKAAHDADPDFDILDSGIASEAWGAMVCRDWIESGVVADSTILRFANDYYDRSVYFGMDFADMDELTTWLYQGFINDQWDRITYMLANMGGAVDALNIKYTEYYWLYGPVMEWIRKQIAQGGYEVEYIVNNEASVWPTHPVVPGVSEYQYARELVQQYCVALSLGVDRTIWFPLSNGTTPTPRIGLLDSLNDWTPAASAFRTAAEIVGHDFAFDHLDNSEASVLQYVFRHRSDGEHHLRVCWYDDGTHTRGSKVVRFDLPQASTRAVVTDYLGNRMTEQVLGRPYVDLTISELPVFLEFYQDHALIPGLAEAGPESSPARLEPNYPNPFNPSTTIRFAVPGGETETREASLAVYDVAGRLVRRLVDGAVAGGRHSIQWDGRTEAGAGAPPGVYLVRLVSGDTVQTRKMILAP